MQRRSCIINKTITHAEKTAWVILLYISFYNLILQILGNINEIYRHTPQTYDQIPIHLGIFLCSFKLFNIRDIGLMLSTAHFKVSFDKIVQYLRPFISFKGSTFVVRKHNAKIPLICAMIYLGS